MHSVETDKPNQSASKSWRSIALELLTLTLLGVVSGTIATFTVLAMSIFVDQLQDPASTTAPQMLGSMFTRIFNVLAVWASAPLDGAIMGLSMGLTVSVAYLVVIWLERSVPTDANRRRIYLVLLPIAGALGAGLGSQGLLVANVLWVAIGGALFGLAAAFVLSTD